MVGRHVPPVTETGITPMMQSVKTPYGKPLQVSR